MEFLIIVAVLGLIPAAIAQSKGHSFLLWWAYGSLIFIVALPHALLTGSNTETQRKCPYCAESVKMEAVVCRHCGRELPAVTP